MWFWVNQIIGFILIFYSSVLFSYITGPDLSSKPTFFFILIFLLKIFRCSETLSLGSRWRGYSGLDTSSNVAHRWARPTDYSHKSSCPFVISSSRRQSSFRQLGNRAMTISPCIWIVQTVGYRSVVFSSCNTTPETGREREGAILMSPSDSLYLNWWLVCLISIYFLAIRYVTLYEL